MLRSTTCTCQALLELRRQRQQSIHRRPPHCGGLVQEAPPQRGLQRGMREPGAEREGLFDGGHKGAGFTLLKEQSVVSKCVHVVRELVEIPRRTHLYGAGAVADICGMGGNQQA